MNSCCPLYSDFFFVNDKKCFRDWKQSKTDYVYVNVKKSCEKKHEIFAGTK